MNLVHFYSAVKARAEADTGTGGLFAGSPLVSAIYSVMAPPGLLASGQYPYLLTNVVSVTGLDGFTIDHREVVFDIHTVAEMRNGPAIGEYIRERLYGDAMAHADRVPTYGFHRHVLELAEGDFVGGVVEHIGIAEQHEEDTFHWVDSFRTHISRAGS
jgi:hypothetical protein